MNTTLTRCTEIRIGDEITESGTPEGPFYRVVKVNPMSLVLDASDEYGPMELRLPFRPSDAVLVRA